MLLIRLLTKSIMLCNKEITRFGYIANKKSLDEKKLAEIKRELTILTFTGSEHTLYVENDEEIRIPKYYGLAKLGRPEVNHLENYPYPTSDMEYLDRLRPKQQVIVEKVYNGLEQHGGGLLIAGCGAGKTNMAIYIACRYKLKTLFVVSKYFIGEQVIARIKSTTNVNEVGIIKRNQVDVDHPFVVGMAACLVMNDYDDLLKDFGLIIFDDDSLPNRFFAGVCQKTSAKYMLGISYGRDYNRYKIINWYLGPILFNDDPGKDHRRIISFAKSLIFQKLFYLKIYHFYYYYEY